MHCYPGALHIHTHYSDGTGTVEEVALAAREAGLRWIIITDHDNLEARPFQGWLHDVLVIVGHEITPDRNHFLALNVDHTVPNTLPPQQFVDAVYDAGGFGIIAHPDERVKNDFKDIYRWDDWAVDGPSERNGRPVGIELWNLMSDWGEQLTKRNKELLFFFPRHALAGPTPETLAWWDRLNVAGKRTFGVGGVDVHAFKKHAPWGEVEVFPYRWTFGTLINYLLLPEPLSVDADIAREQVFGALAGGRSYFINGLEGACSELVFRASRGSKQWALGDTISLADGPVTLEADVGVQADVRVIRNGRVALKGVRAIRHTLAEAGVYRLEAYRRGRPWLYSNYLYVEA